MTGNTLTRRLAVTGVVAAVYVVLTMAVLPFAFYGVQFRISELLNLLVFINPVFAPGVILGVFLSNLLFSSIAFDWLIGTLSTVLAVFLIARSKRLGTASIWPVLCSGLIVGAMLAFLTGFYPPFGVTFTNTAFARFALFSLSVMIGQFAVCVAVGIPLFRLIMRNQGLMSFFATFGPNSIHIAKYTGTIKKRAS